VNIVDVILAVLLGALLVVARVVMLPARILASILRHRRTTFAQDLLHRV